ncbi:hypothetical protein [Larkinella terrae]|uniref:Uncharacterized protein n=1 Tax=Larkinella terrae TaxID=2025311 RepID=A0A7K0EP63_9BACT|nr:hypothetical protein [Larkinella terrae]MRS63633.1 hypothetical protein [Larkinella terrae]
METQPSKFPADFQELLSGELALEPFVTTEKTPFRLLRVADTPIILHCIDFETYETIRQRADLPVFFQQLTDRFLAKSLQLIHLWEDVWRSEPVIVRSRLRAMVGLSERIPARLTQVRRIDKPTAGRFLQENHLQVVTHSKYKYGLFLPARYFRVLPSGFAIEPANATELLVAVATFSYPRQVIRDGSSYRSVELVRFANRLNVTVVGGLDKLLKAFTTDARPDDIMTYADRDWSNGRSYEKLGFTRLEETAPNRFWVRPDEWIRHYPSRLPAGLTENEMPAKGYIPVYNSGSVKFVKLS